ncbi:MAG: hypothetical protein GF364_13560, partial [Candidatus Lokiarchaeota archaeon]|nr:hypothetical protein [Candidatus Lokiarchaeota archaeon]
MMEKARKKIAESKVDNYLKSASNLTFLVGAGISMDPPTSLPSAIEIGQTLIRLCTPKKYHEKLMKIQSLRFEMIISQMVIYIGDALSYLDYFDLYKKPNLIHYFLAHILEKKSLILTTNFDNMVEYAAMNIYGNECQDLIVPVITKEDFLQYSEPNDILTENKYGIYKIHGSKTDVIKQRDTTQSLITTMESLGKNKKKGETFSLESFKRIAFNNLTRDRTLVVMGYSGNDDFDIGPTLKKINGIRRLIWIEHSKSLKCNTMKFNIIDKTSKDDGNRLNKLLKDISHRNNCNIIKISVNTGNFVREKLWP